MTMLAIRQLLFLLAFAPLSVYGQPAAPAGPLTFAAAVRRAASVYPTVRVSAEQLAAARAGINLARTAYLPRIDATAQVNRATRNNVYGLLFPNSVIAPISGPVLPATANNVWGTAVGALVSWEPFDFGQRELAVNIAASGAKRAEASLARVRFDTAALAADAWLTLAAAGEAVRSADAAVERSRTLEQMVGAVVKAGLRPGADLSRAQAESALAGTQLAQARQAEAVARASLAQMIASTAGAEAIAIAPGRMTELPPEPPAANATTVHPRAVEQSAAIEEVRAREAALDAAWRPRFALQGAAYGRGSGARLDNTSGGFGSGLGPDTGNWAVGLSINFPVMDYASIRARKQAEAANERAEAARLEQIQLELRGQAERAKANLEGAAAIARNTPVQLTAAREAEKQAMARYKAGLATATDVADAERLLAQAETDDALARLNVWRALLALAVANGDLEPLLAISER